MKVRYIAFSAKKKGDNYTVSSKGYDITEYLTSITWGGSKKEVSRKVILTMANSLTDPNFKGITLKLGGMIYLYDDNNKELYRGYVIDRERSNKAEVTYTSYDLCFYLLKSSATYKFSGKTPEAITEAVCKDMKIPCGEIAKTGKKYKLLMKDKSIYQVIMAAYTKAYKSTGDKYWIYASKGKLCVAKMVDKWFKIQLDPKKNITSISTKENISDVVNRVKIYDDKNKLVKVVEDKESEVKYGILQHTYTKEKDVNATNRAKNMLKGVKRTIDLECIGYVGAVAGKCVKVVSGADGVEGKYYIDSDTHTWKDGIHTMKLTLTKHTKMDTQSAD